MTLASIVFRREGESIEIKTLYPFIYNHWFSSHPPVTPCISIPFWNQCNNCKYLPCSCLSGAHIFIEHEQILSWEFSLLNTPCMSEPHKVLERSKSGVDGDSLLGGHLNVHGNQADIAWNFPRSSLMCHTVCVLSMLKCSIKMDVLYLR